MASLYADENFPFPVVVRLRALGHDVLTALEDGRAGQKIPDPDVLARATELERISGGCGVCSLARRASEGKSRALAGASG
jgi:hypothetical protein